MTEELKNDGVAKRPIDDIPISIKDKIDSVNGLISILYKCAAAVGGVITFSYLFAIEFFPSGLAGW